MIHPIVRLYASADNAEAAVGKLQARGFGVRQYDLIAPPAEPADGAAATETVTAAIADAYVVRAQARLYAARVLDGHWLVIVRAPIGMGLIAEDLLDECDPVPSGFEPSPDRPMAWDESAPMSSSLHFGTILRDPTPFSNWMAGLPVLSRSGKRTCERLNIPELADSGWTFSGKVGLKLLSTGAAPLSGKLKWPLLSRGPAPLSSKLGLPLLSGKAAPLSSSLHIPTKTASD
ncbi:MAG: hypothetical protein JJT93_02050 [Gammaproteobacteria bacterium]|nr:hypothetical protein [Gammaproteobacteria bacterium]